jgi:hypothetical protein
MTTVLHAVVDPRRFSALCSTLLFTCRGAVPVGYKKVDKFISQLGSYSSLDPK